MSEAFRYDVTFFLQAKKVAKRIRHLFKLYTFWKTKGQVRFDENISF